MKDNRFFFHMAVLLVVVSASTSCTLQLIRLPPPTKVAFESVHGRYVTAMGSVDDWVLGQEIELKECGWFTQRHLANGKVALVTCYDKYITAPESCTERQDCMLRQESELGDCGQFELYELGSDKVALRTRAKRFWTAGDGNWPPGLQWRVIAETTDLLDWERFTVLRP